MACFESGTVISLWHREAITLPDVRGATLRVTQGTLWLTQEHERHDIVLRPGDNWVVEYERQHGRRSAERRGVLHRRAPRRSAEAAGAREARAGVLATLAAFFGPPPRQIPYV